MIGQQHQRAADQVGGVLVVGRPGRAICRCSGFGEVRAFSMVATTSRMMRPPTIARPSGARVKAPRIGAGGERQHGDGAIDRVGPRARRRRSRAFRRRRRAIVRRERIDAGDIPQQRRGVFQRVALGEIDAVDAAIDRAVLGDGRDRRIHHRQIGIETAHAARLRRRRAPLLQRADVLGPVAMAARIRRRLGADQPAADIGVERRRRDREFGGGLAGGEVKAGGFFHIDLHNQD